ncbi:MAG: hypothetical protein Q9201_002750 [Fulgogasparrea decipioides]
MSNDRPGYVDPEESGNQEASSLFRRSSHDAEQPASLPKAKKPPTTERRKSSLAFPTPDGAPRTPRTANRVRFDFEERESNGHALNGRISEETAWLEEEDYFSHYVSTEGRRSISQRAPLLTEIEAPSVTVATTDFDFNAEDLLENARPKSGMGSAFMNMANSIMYACRYYTRVQELLRSGD